MALAEYEKVQELLGEVRTDEGVLIDDVIDPIYTDNGSEKAFLEEETTS